MTTGSSVVRGIAAPHLVWHNMWKDTAEEEQSCLTEEQSSPDDTEYKSDLCSVLLSHINRQEQEQSGGQIIKWT